VLRSSRSASNVDTSVFREIHSPFTQKCKWAIFINKQFLNPF